MDEISNTGIICIIYCLLLLANEKGSKGRWRLVSLSCPYLFTVRPSKNVPIFLFFIQSGKVPKVRGWEGNLKSLSCNVGGARVDEGALREMILGFVVEHLIFGTQNFYIYKRKSPKCPRISGVLKRQLPSIIDFFDRCFSHTTGEGL